MLKQINGREDTSGACVLIGRAAFPEPFYDGLQYSPPARGTWNIVHTAMLVPESHQIYICALGCLRGVVLTAAEMGAMNRFSSIAIEDHELYDGTMEDTIVQAVGEIIDNLPAMPSVFFLYPSCVHHFMGCDMEALCGRLRQIYSQARFVLCWMDPIRRQSGLTAELRTRRQLYSLLQRQEIDRQSVNIVGSNLPIQADCELVRLIENNGLTLRQLPCCRTYGEYEQMGASFLNIGQEPLAKICLADMEKRLGQKSLYLSNSFDCDEIRRNLWAAADALTVVRLDYTEAAAACEAAFAETRAIVGAMPVAIDYAAVSRPFSLAKALLRHGFNVRRIYVDVCCAEDQDDFAWIQNHYPALELYATRHAKMRRMDRHTAEPMLAIGQKAAYFTGTCHFVDMAEGGGLRDFAGLRRLLQWMVQAREQEKEAKAYISIKGWGCPSCQ